MANVVKTRWAGGRRPFTIISVGCHTPLLYTHDDTSGKVWLDLASGVPAWQQKLPQLLDYTAKHRAAPQHSTAFQDVDPYATHFLLVDPISDVCEQPPPAEDTLPSLWPGEGKGPASQLITEICRNLADKVPAIAIKLGHSSPGVLHEQDANSLARVIDRMEAGVPVLLLDVYPRAEPPEIPSQRQQVEQQGATRSRSQLDDDGAGATEGSLGGRQALIDWARTELERHAESKLHGAKRRTRGSDVCDLAWLHSILYADGFAESGIKSGAGTHQEKLWQALERVAEGRVKKSISDLQPATPAQVKEIAWWYAALVAPPEVRATDGSLAPDDAAGISDNVAFDFEGTPHFAYGTRALSILSNRKCHSANIRGGSKRMDALVRQLCRSDRLPIENSLQSLRLLQQAWDELDICEHLASRYKWWTKGLFLLNLLLALAVIVLSTIWVDLCGDETEESSPSPSSCAPQGRHLQAAVFILSVVASFVLSFEGYQDAHTKWRQLRSAAGELHSVIWCYRGRISPFALPAADLEAEAPEKALSEVLTKWRQELMGSSLSTSSFKRVYAHSVYRHHQRRPPPGSKGGGARMKLTRPSAQHHEDDDHFSPVRPSAYIELRLLPVIRFYRGRIPGSQRRRYACKLIILLSTVAAAILSRYEYVQYVTIVAACSSAVSTLAEFQDSTRKLERYSRAIAALENLLTWWESKKPIEQSSRANVSHLISEGEAIIANERLAWVSTAMKGSIRQQEEEEEEVGAARDAGRGQANGRTRVSPA